MKNFQFLLKGISTMQMQIEDLIELSKDVCSDDEDTIAKYCKIILD
jgi:hypothetical protein